MYFVVVTRGGKKSQLIDVRFTADGSSSWKKFFEHFLFTVIPFLLRTETQHQLAFIPFCINYKHREHSKRKKKKVKNWMNSSRNLAPRKVFLHFLNGLSISSSMLRIVLCSFFDDVCTISTMTKNRATSGERRRRKTWRNSNALRLKISHFVWRMSMQFRWGNFICLLCIAFAREPWPRTCLGGEKSVGMGADAARCRRWQQLESFHSSLDQKPDEKHE